MATDTTVSGAATLDAPSISHASELHVFSINDIIGDFAGNTYAEDSSIINLDAPSEEDLASPYIGFPPVPFLQDKDGNTLYPVDSEFGFNVSDFSEATQKELDGDYTEGWAGNIQQDVDGDGTPKLAGLALVNAETDTFKSGLPLGTWAAGLGGNSVKASTEQYTVMAHLLSDQKYAASADGTYSDPDAIYPLDNNLIAIGGEFDGRPVTEVVAELETAGDDRNEDGVYDIRDVLEPNESTTSENIAASSDYSVTLKDDGKLLYRWGTIVKRPNDIRMQVQLDLPESWTSGVDSDGKGISDVEELNGGLGYKVKRAELVITHDITNNPNDQIRPEDYENEAATGRKPSYYVVVDPEDSSNTLWVSPVDTYDGSGAFLPSYFKLTGTGEIDLTAGGTAVFDPDGTLVGYRNADDAGNPIGTVLRDFSLIEQNGEADLPFTSSDLTGGFTNEYYTSTDRDPFEWSYDRFADNPYKNVYEGFASRDEAEAAGFTDDSLVAGPRWRLKSNKFGQNIPGVEIPLEANSEPPFEKDNIRYEVGDLTTTTINLLDWKDENGNGLADDSPLLYSSGWTQIDPTRLDVDEDGTIDEGWSSVNGVLQAGDALPDGPIVSAVTPNGLKLTPEFFDTAVYLKGDRRDSAKIFNTQLIVEYEANPFADLDIGLYDAELDELIATLNEGDEILASTLTGRDLTIAAFVPETSAYFDEVESAFLNLNDGQAVRTENVEPYSLFGDISGDFWGGDIPTGTNTIDISLYSQDRLQGDLLGTVSRSFTIVDDSVITVGLYDAQTDELIRTIQDGDEILASTLSNNLSIAATVPASSPLFGDVESVYLDLNDGEATRIENREPYSLFGDFQGDYNAGDIPTGDNTITFDLYSKNRLKGDLLDSISRSFTIVNDIDADDSSATELAASLEPENASQSQDQLQSNDSQGEASAAQSDTSESDVDQPLNSSPTYTATYTFSTDDILGTFDGETQGDLGTVIDFNAEPLETKEGIDLYPINSEFGFNVSDFEGAEQKDFNLDPEYEEGWAGDLASDTGEQLGLIVSNAETQTFQTPNLLGTWLVGMGGEAVKASTERYSVMQNVLSDQRYPGDPDALKPLDDNLIAIGGEFEGRPVAEVVTELEAAGDDRNGDGVYSILDVLAPNENTVTENIAASSDYSVTLKDDGKLLYRWGNLVKRPTDIRINAELPLPEEWTSPNEETGLLPLYQVSQAELVIRHTVSNNPNDQIRPEDYENEGATGRLPSFVETADGQWISTDDYFAGDGTYYPAGTVLKDPELVANSEGSLLAQIGARSADLQNGLTNAWYTTQDREPFEPVLTASGDGYEVGPRWRLKSNKYGQDLPGVEIPQDPSLPPPPTKDEVKYEVGADTQTVINLLDWNGISPFTLSAGWQEGDGTVSENGLKLTKDFDVSYYIKGDRKPITLYGAELVMSYDEVDISEVGDVLTGTSVDDILVGQGGNTFTGLEGKDLFVVSYGVEAVEDITVSTINDFNVAEGDSLGLISLGITSDNFADRLTQSSVAEGLQINVDGQQVATLVGVQDSLSEESFYLV